MYDIEVGISNADDLSPSVLGAQASIIIYLYEWTDLNGDGDCQTADETLLVGFNQYDFRTAILPIPYSPFQCLTRTLSRARQAEERWRISAGHAVSRSQLAFRPKPVVHADEQ